MARNYFIMLFYYAIGIKSKGEFELLICDILVSLFFLSYE